MPKRKDPTDLALDKLLRALEPLPLEKRREVLATAKRILDRAQQMLERQAAKP